MAHTHSIKQYPGQMIALAGIAAGLGALTAALVTPKKGSELRHTIAERTKSLKRSKDQAAGSEQDAGTNMASRTKDVAKSVATRVKGTASKVKEDTKQTGNEAQDATKGNVTDTKNVADEIRRNGEP